MIPYSKQSISKEDIEAVTDVLSGNYLTTGPAVSAFERDISEYVGARYCVAVSNGTAALHLAIAALNLDNSFSGITSTNSFVASANCFLYNGGRPVLADIDPSTLNISLDDAKDKIREDTKVIIPVHFAGLPCSMEEIKTFADTNGLHVVEDACHALGAAYSSGTKVGSCDYSDMTVFSFHPVKSITTGEGGAITTNDTRLYERLCILRNHGMLRARDSWNNFRIDKSISLPPGSEHSYYEIQCLGFNYRLSDIHAALGSSQLKRLDQFVARRREIAAAYSAAFKEFPELELPPEKGRDYSAWHLYVLRLKNSSSAEKRNMFMASLSEAGIHTQVHYIPIHQHPLYKKMDESNVNSCSYAETYHQQCLSIPIYPSMSDNDIELVIRTIKEKLKTLHSC